ncbi:MAG: PTS system fructose subfamily IIA component [Ghiorsea sp.]
MIGIVLVAHAHIATETKAAVEHILGKQELFAVIDIANSDASRAEQDKYSQLIMSHDQGEGVLVLVDLFGATPWNIAAGRPPRSFVEVIAGFNVPAVIKAITLRKQNVNLQELAQASITSGQQYMRLVSGGIEQSDS